MEDLETIDIEEKVERCNRLGGCWALEKEGLSYCFISSAEFILDDKPNCMAKKSRITTMNLYSAADGFQKITARHYVCGIKNCKE